MRAFGAEGIAPSILSPESDGRQGAAPRGCHFTAVLNGTGKCVSPNTELN